MDSMRKLEEIFAHFPGIGPRQAKRFVYYILNRPNSSIREFTDLIHEVKKSTAQCGSCYRIFIGHGEKMTQCSICSDKNRDASLLMIVARDSDFETIEKSGVYKGLYFILGGIVSSFDAEPEKRIRLEALIKRLRELGSSLKEIILSMNTTPDGDSTAMIVSDYVKASLPESGLQISVLGRGLSTGAELEYVDGDTIRNAFQNRG